ncbi:MAG: hypothetical protein JXR58_01555, partial [Bacteroidales bacterium]|nr:hypothetical protein [Bacteroidales bacterium]
RFSAFFLWLLFFSLATVLRGFALLIYSNFYLFVFVLAMFKYTPDVVAAIFSQPFRLWIWVFFSACPKIALSFFC